MFYDTHTHTKFSADSQMTIESAIDAAIKNNLKGIAFTDHFDYNYSCNGINENIEFDYSIGFSSYQLHETVHRKTKCIQIYYTHLLPPSSSPLVPVYCNDEEAIFALNSNKNAFQILRTKKYINYIKSNPCYKKIIFLKYDSLVIGVAFEINEENSVRIVELSNYSFESCMTAYRMASFFGNPVKIDFPQKLDIGIFLKETCFDIFSRYSNYHTFNEEDLIWVPHSDRK